MKKFLNKAAIWLSHTLMVSCLFLLPSAFLLTFFLSQPATVKRMLDDSRLYEGVSSVVADAAVTSVQGMAESYGLPQQMVKKVSQKVFSSKQLQKKGDKLVDDIYFWLRGERSELKINFELQKDQQTLLQALSDELVKTETAKPVCTLAQLRQVAEQKAEPNILQLECKPDTLSVDALKDLFTTNIASADDLAETNNVAVTQQEPTVIVPNKISGISVPFVFWLLAHSFYILFGTAMLTFLMLWLLLKNVNKFFTHLFKPLLTTGALLLFYSLFLQWVIGQNLFTKIVGTQQGQLIERVSHPFLFYSVRICMIFGIVYLIFGVVLLITMNKAQRSNSNDSTSTAQADVMYNESHD